MQRNRHDIVVVDIHLIDDLCQQLLAGFFRLIHVSTLIPVRPEMPDQVGGFMQLVIVNRTQGLNLTLKLDALFEVFVLIDEPVIPPEIDALDDGLNLLHTLRRGCALPPLPVRGNPPAPRARSAPPPLAR
jgi:hypothetical protein